VVDRLADGDTVTVVSFDTSTELVVSPTVLDAQSRGRIHQAVSGIRLGGDTCISCGVEHAMSELRRVSRGNELQRVIVLSDGAANNGVRDVPGFQQLARTCRDMGIAVSTVGVGIDYNERVLSTLALESNGLHHFAESDSELQAVFEAETRTAISTVASNAEARIAVMPGVSLRRVFGRAFRREGDKIIVPLGTFSPGEVKTVLMEVDIQGNEFGPHNVADVVLSYTDLVKDSAVTAHGALATTIADSTDALDPFVSARLQQAHTTASLNVASDLAKAGDFDGARRALERRRDELRASAAKPRAKPDARGADIDRNLERQAEFAEEAIDGLAQPAAPAETQRAVRKNQTRIFANEL
jgi:Ca-activated chloride channel family protein